MKANVYVIVGQYCQEQADKSLWVNELLDCLKHLGEVNIFDMPTAESTDSGETEGNITIHRYAAPEGNIGRVTERAAEIVRDIVHLGAKECYIDYGVSSEYQPLIRMIHNALRTYGIRVYSINQARPFRWVRNLIWDLKFWWQETKLEMQLEKEIEQAEGLAGRGSMQGFVTYKKFQAEQAERKRLHQLRKQQ